MGTFLFLRYTYFCVLQLIPFYHHFMSFSFLKFPFKFYSQSKYSVSKNFHLIKYYFYVKRNKKMTGTTKKNKKKILGSTLQ